MKTKTPNLWQPDGAGANTATKIGAWTVGSLTGVKMEDTPVGRERRAMIRTGASNGNSSALSSAQSLSTQSGFLVTGHFCPFATGVAGKRKFFAGISPALIPISANFLTTPMIGVHADLQDATLKVRGVRGVIEDLGSDFPSSSPDAWYRLMLMCFGGGAVSWQIENTVNGAIKAGAFESEDLADPAAFYATRCIVYTTSGVQAIWLGDWSI